MATIVHGNVVTRMSTRRVGTVQPETDVMRTNLLVREDATNLGLAQDEMGCSRQRGPKRVESPHASERHASLINSSPTNMGTDGGRPVRPASWSEGSFGRDRNRSFHLRTVLSRQRSARAIAALL